MEKKMEIDYFLQEKSEIIRLNKFSKGKAESPRIGETIVHEGDLLKVVDVRRYIEQDNVLVYLEKK